jgi:methyl-accepting chemotaxis protein
MRFPIKAKLVMAFGVVLVLLGASAYEAVVSLGELNQTVVELADGPALRVQQAGALKAAALQVSRATNKMLSITDDAEIERQSDQIPTLEAEVAVAAGAYRKLSAEEGQQLVDEFLAAWTQYQAHLATMRRLAADNSDRRAYEIVTGKGASDYAALAAAIDQASERASRIGGVSSTNAELVHEIDLVLARLFELRITTMWVLLESDQAKVAEYLREVEAGRSAVERALATLEQHAGTIGIAADVQKVRAA